MKKLLFLGFFAILGALLLLVLPSSENSVRLPVQNHTLSLSTPHAVPFTERPRTEGPQEIPVELSELPAVPQLSQEALENKIDEIDSQLAGQQLLQQLNSGMISKLKLLKLQHLLDLRNQYFAQKLRYDLEAIEQ